MDLIDTSDPQQSVNDVNHYFISVGKLAENIKKNIAFNSCCHSLSSFKFSVVQI